MGFTFFKAISPDRTRRADQFEPTLSSGRGKGNHPRQALPPLRQSAGCSGYWGGADFRGDAIEGEVASPYAFRQIGPRALTGSRSEKSPSSTSNPPGIGGRGSRPSAVSTRGSR